MSLSNISDIRTSIAGWQTEWGPAATWAKNFHHTLSRVQEKGRRATDEFFSQCEDHVREGRAILRDLQLLAHHPPNKGSKQVKDTYIQIYDLLSAVLMEVFFFELKLDEYAPAVPLSKLFLACFTPNLVSKSLTERGEFLCSSHWHTMTDAGGIYPQGHIICAMDITQSTFKYSWPYLTYPVSGRLQSYRECHWIICR